MKSVRSGLLVLLLATIAISVVALLRGWSTPLEAFGFITGAIAVWLSAKENVWNWPIGLLNVSAYAYVFGRERLYADAGLQLVYFVLGILGWYWWLHGGAHRRELRVSRTPSNQWLPLLGLGVAATGILWAYLTGVHDAAPLLDAFTTAFSLVAQYMLTRKYIENWTVWILVDLVYVPLYAWKGLYLTAVLYAVFTLMAIGGLREWSQSSAEGAKPPGWGFVKLLCALGAAVWLWMGYRCWQMESFYGSETIAAIRSGVGATAAHREIPNAAFPAVKAELLDPLKSYWSPGEWNPIPIASIAFAPGGTRVDLVENRAGRLGVAVGNRAADIEHIRQQVLPRAQ